MHFKQTANAKSILGIEILIAEFRGKTSPLLFRNKSLKAVQQFIRRKTLSPRSLRKGKLFVLSQQISTTNIDQIFFILRMFGMHCHDIQQIEQQRSGNRNYYSWPCLSLETLCSKLTDDSINVGFSDNNRFNDYMLQTVNPIYTHKFERLH